jgi:hypothetical protein
MFDNNELARDRELYPTDWKVICAINPRPTWHIPYDFCGEGRWEEWFSDQVIIWRYTDINEYDASIRSLKYE